jgi:hypothetical protein
MKMEVVQKTMAAAAVAMLIAGCGGGGGGGSPPSPSLTVSGTAATGAGLANAAVEMKCATGNGTTTTTSSGSYTLTLQGGALPCMIKVSGTAGGIAVTLHSVTEAGSIGAEQKTSALANVTPITEMIVAQLTAALPASSFGSFDASRITAASVTSATNAVVAALKAAGIDLGSIDPLKATLVPATGTTAGNPYDQLLDALGEKVGPEALPLLVNQIATAAGTSSSGGLTSAMAGLSGGSLEGCPSVVSGKYRTLDLYGKTAVRSIDFAKKTFTAVNGDILAIATDAAKPCTYTVTGTSDGKDVAWDVVMGANGVGSYRARFTNPASAGTNGYIFLEQGHPVSAVAGTWSFLQSGYMPSEGTIHLPGQITFNADNKVTTCDYDAAWACIPETTAGMTVSARSDGGFDLNESSLKVAQFYAYKAPNGAVVLFGSTNAAGVNDVAVEQTSLIASKLTAATVPALNTVTNYWDVSYSRLGSSVTAVAPVAESHTVINVDSGTSKTTRRRLSDGREDVVQFNAPLTGLRTREAGTWNGVPYAKVYQIPLQGLGVTVSVNSVPASPTTNFIHNISVVRP